jgi:hypothetical protein
MAATEPGITLRVRLTRDQAEALADLPVVVTGAASHRQICDAQTAVRLVKDAAKTATGHTRYLP